MKIGKRLLAFIITIALLIAGFGGYRLYGVYAAPMLELSKCMTYAQFKAGHTIPDSTIFIGTHLIYMDAATDELWMQAEESMTVSNQTTIYYKSELAGGAWYEIEGVLSIDDISDAGIPIDENELSNLYVEYYTFQDGKTRNAVGDGRHCIFDGEYPYYDLYHLEELGNLKTQYDTLVSRDTDSRMDNYYIGLFNRSGNSETNIPTGLYRHNLNNELTQELDESLYALQDIYDALNDADRSEDAETIYKLMAKLDHSRRAEVFRQLIDDETLDIMNKFVNMASGTGYNTEDDDEFIINNDIVDAAGNDMEACGTSYINHLSNALIENDSARVIDTLVYNLSMEIINGATGGLNDTMDTNIRNLGYLFNIDEGNVVHSEEELAVIQTDIIDAVSRKFSDAISQAPSQKYREARDSGLGETALLNILEEQEGEIDMVRLELQEIITAEYDRMPEDTSIEDCKNRINWTYDLYGRVSTGEIKPNEENQIALHIEWLTQKLKEEMESVGSANALLDELMNQYEELLAKQQQALDNGDLGLARELAANLDVLKGKIDDENKRLQDILNDPNASASDKAEAQAMMGEDSMGAVVDNMVNEALSDISAGDFDGLDKAIDALTALGDTEGLKEIKDSLDSKPNAPEAVKNKVDEAIKGVDGTDDAGNATGDNLQGAIEGLLGNLDNLSAEDLASVIRAVELIHRDGSLPAGDLSARLVVRYASKLKKYRYSRATNGSARLEYADLDILSNAVGYRYLYTEKKKLATVTNLRTSSIYKLNVGTTEVKLQNDSKVGDLAGECIFSNGIAYASVDFASDYLNAVACHIKRSSYGLCLTKSMEEKAQELYTQLKELFPTGN